MSESIEQAAIARADRNAWKARAEREAAAILDGVGVSGGVVTRDFLVTLLAVAWIQGVDLGSHETLASANAAFARLREAL